MTESNPAAVIKKLKTLRDGLSDLSMRNRSLRLSRLPKKRAFDLAWLNGAHPGNAGLVLERVLAGHKRNACLLEHRIEDQAVQSMHRGLVYLDREVRLVEQERGVYDLALGFLFLCGTVATGKYIQAPLFLLPRRLELERRGGSGTRWVLAPIDEPKEVNVNRTLLLALQKYADVSLDLEELEDAGAQIFGKKRSASWMSELATMASTLLKKQGHGS